MRYGGNRFNQTTQDGTIRFRIHADRSRYKRVRKGSKGSCIAISNRQFPQPTDSDTYHTTQQRTTAPELPQNKGAGRGSKGSQ
jgi:hypothetical protein